MAEPVVIVGMGACTAVGRGAWESAAAVRAGISGFSLHPFMVDTMGEPMQVAMAPWLDVGLQGVERFEALVLPAIHEALAVLPRESHARQRWALALALPCARAGLPTDLSKSLLASIRRRWPSLFNSAAIFDAGHAAGLLGVRSALSKVGSGAFDGCLVAGVDGYMSADTLEWLEANDQLHGAGPLNNAWGFVPGEAGAALLLMRGPVARDLALPPLAVVLGAGSSFEAKRIKTKTVCIGEGLTQAIRAALSVLPPGAAVSDIYCDMNGEPYRGDEYGFTALRTKEHFVSVSDFVAPADCWGDVGAAGGLLHIGLGCASFVKQYGRGDLGMAWASAETGERAAAVFSSVA